MIHESKHILIVADRRDFQKLVREMFSQYDKTLQFHIVNSVKTFRKLFREDESVAIPDTIVFGHHLPQLSAVDLLHERAAIHRLASVPCYVISDASTPNMGQYWQTLGARGHISQEMRPSTLKSIFAEIFLDLFS